MDSVSFIKMLFSATTFLVLLEFSQAEYLQTANQTVLSWNAPEEISKNYRYYIAGYDFEKRPVVVWEWGRWNIRKYVEAGGEALERYKRYSAQFVERIANLKSPYEDAEEGVVVICDAEGFSNYQLTHPPTLAFLLQEALYLNKVEPNVHKAFIINSNFVMEALVNLIRNIGGKLFERIEIYGVNKSRWIPVLQQNIPKEQLPPWYGGKGEYKAVQIFG